MLFAILCASTILYTIVSTMVAIIINMMAKIHSFLLQDSFSCGILRAKIIPSKG
jgi:hypothetical protein